MAKIFSLGCLEIGTSLSRFSSTNSLTNICKTWYIGITIFFQKIVVLHYRWTNTCFVCYDSRRSYRCFIFLFWGLKGLVDNISDYDEHLVKDDDDNMFIIHHVLIKTLANRKCTYTNLRFRLIKDILNYTYCYTFSIIINGLLTKLVQSRLDIGQVLFCYVYEPRLS